MRLIRDDIPWLSRSIALFLCSGAFAIGIPVMGQTFLQKMVMEESGAEKALDEANEKIRQAKREREGAGAYRALYRRLVEQGVVGQFRRLELIEHLEKMGPDFFDMQYAVSPQKRIPMPGFFSLNVNRAVFNLGLLHEGRLLEFFDALGRGGDGIPLVEGCSMERISEAQNLAYEPHLKAGCTVLWVTLEAAK